jgi:hypothetical protein
MDEVRLYYTPLDISVLRNQTWGEYLAPKGSECGGEKALPVYACNSSSVHHILDGA